mmetsp:Transcript_933/g.1169  ORF Transcript_933/g.1169 Transcript_933/m.1169 type:complete len:81 (+) Transcript_933:279-521(+)
MHFLLSYHIRKAENIKYLIGFKFSLLSLFLWSKLICVTTFLLAAVGSTKWETCVTFAAYLFIAVEFPCKGSKGWFDNPPS